MLHELPAYKYVLEAKNLKEHIIVRLCSVTQQVFYNENYVNTTKNIFFSRIHPYLTRQTCKRDKYQVTNLWTWIGTWNK